MERETLLRENWDIGEVQEIEEIDSFSENEVSLIKTDRDKYVLKIQEDVGNIQREAKLLSYLERKVPIAAPIKTGEDYFVREEGRHYVLYPFLEGESYTNHYQDRPHEKAFLLGETIGELHYYLQDIDFAECKKMDLRSEVLEWAQDIIRQHKSQIDYDFVMKMMDKFRVRFGPIYPSLCKHIIHRDLHPGNILFADDKVTGIVDFELSVEAVRLFDPCYCATSMLVSGFSDQAKRNSWIEIFNSLLGGYEQKFVLSPEERASIPYVLYSIQLIFMAYSFTTDSFEAAEYNEQVLKWLVENEERLEG